MVRRAFLAAVLIIVAIGIYALATLTPQAPRGSLTLTAAGKTHTLSGYPVERVYKSKTEPGDRPVVKGLADIIPVVRQKAGAHTFTGELEFTGETAGNATYAVLSADGAVLVTDGPTLVLPPAEQTDFIVCVSVKWGKPRNYTLTEYYFRVKRQAPKDE
ncbi:MAG: hypothetical protein QM689_07545 [Oscillospiraceae bacterium]